MNYNDFGLRVDYVEYTVQKGDSLYEIAKKYNTTVSDLTDVNMLTSNAIFPGQVLLIPQNTSGNEYFFENYIIQPGDTIELVAKRQGIDPILLGLYNDFSSYQLASGQTLKIPRNNTYTVKNNDTLDTIISVTNRTPEDILRANSTTWLKAGSKIYL